LVTTGVGLILTTNVLGLPTQELRVGVIVYVTVPEISADVEIV